MSSLETASLSRRMVLGTAAAAAAGALMPAAAAGGFPPEAYLVPSKSDKPLFLISLAEWSFHNAIWGQKMTNLDFPHVARHDFGIDAIEYVNSFFMDKAKDGKYLADLKKRCADEGVQSRLIMCDGEGELGDADDQKRKIAVENHYKWADAAKLLGCFAIRVNAASSGTPEEQERLAADGLRRLTEYCAKQELDCIVENHGGLSSNGGWLARVMKRVDHPRCGTLPDFGNFNLGEGKQYDRYQGVREMMPYAKAVSAKSYAFDEKGDETTIDYHKMMRIVLDAGYWSYLGIEYEGSKLSEPDGVKATKKLLERVRDEIAAERRKK